MVASCVFLYNALSSRQIAVNEPELEAGLLSTWRAVPIGSSAFGCMGQLTTRFCCVPFPDYMHTEGLHSAL